MLLSPSRIRHIDPARHPGYSNKRHFYSILSCHRNPSPSCFSTATHYTSPAPACKTKSNPVPTRTAIPVPSPTRFEFNLQVVFLAPASSLLPSHFPTFSLSCLAGLLFQFSYMTYKTYKTYSLLLLFPRPIPIYRDSCASRNPGFCSPPYGLPQRPTEASYIIPTPRR